jgi:hypothetical protein
MNSQQHSFFYHPVDLSHENPYSPALGNAQKKRFCSIYPFNLCFTGQQSDLFRTFLSSSTPFVLRVGCLALIFFFWQSWAGYAYYDTFKDDIY